MMVLKFRGFKLNTRDVEQLGSVSDEKLTTAGSSMDSQIRKYIELANEEDTQKLKEYIGELGCNHQDKERLGKNAIVNAASYGYLQAIKNLVALGGSINEKDEDGRSLLHIACLQGWKEGVEYILENGGDPALTDKNSRTALHACTIDSSIECFQLVINFTPEPLIDSRDGEMMTPLHWASFHNRPDHLKLLISKGAKLSLEDCDSRTALHWACQKGSLECVKLLLESDEGQLLVNLRDKSGKGAIHYAAAAGHPEIIRCLGAIRTLNIHLDDPNDRQPLHWAAAMGRLTCVKLLLELGADPTVHDIDARNALHYAYKAGHTECGAWISQTLAAMKREHENGVVSTYYTGDVERNADGKERISEPRRSGDKSPPTPVKSITGELQRVTVKPAVHHTDELNTRKLPPIRGTPAPKTIVNDGRESDSIVKNSPLVSGNLDGQLKPANKAMKFIPTQALYTEDVDN